MLLEVLLMLLVIIVTARVVGFVFVKLRQPAVIGEIVGGILLGPSLLGRLAPDVSARLLPPAVVPMISLLAQLGVIFYMFLVGLQHDLQAMRSRATMTIAISTAGIIVPFIIGLTLAWALWAYYAPSNVTVTAFALFFGVAMSITAFPVLARILDDRAMQHTPTGIMALSCAAIDDVAAWCLLVCLLNVMQSTALGVLGTVTLTTIYIALMLTLGKAIMSHAAARLDNSPRIDEGGLTLILAAMLVSAVATELIGIHAIFGAFLLGAVVPHKSKSATRVRAKIEGLVRVMLLPVFFAFTGLRTQIELVETVSDWMVCLTIIVLAVAGKFGGVTIAARVTGLSWRDSSALGILMNTRGLVELIVLNIGLDLGVISPRLFTMLVIMAVVTTMLTSPVLSLLSRNDQSLC